LITSLFQGSNTKSFDLHELYFGCVLATEEGLANVLTACTVKITGYRASDIVDEHTFDFKPPALQVVADLERAPLPATFRNLETVTFETTSRTPGLTATVLDNVRYTTYNK
jgi:hypothetical protein